MNLDLNPYLPPVEVVSPDNSLDRLASNSVTIAGMLIALGASLGSIARCFAEYNSFVSWQAGTISSGVWGVLAIIALAIATWLVLALMTSITRFVPSDYTTFSKTMLLIASVAMVARLITEPSTAWSPTWPSYVLTFAGTTALAMVSYRMRTQQAG